ncbi:hypothetical protein ACWIGI_00950 [Nocardia sp. NPDC055321]
MRDWHDIFTNDHVMSKSFATAAVSDARGDVVTGLFEVESRIVAQDGSPLAPGDADTPRVNNVIDDTIGFGYTETGFETKGELKEYLKGYFQRVLRHLKDNGASPDQLQRFETDAMGILKHLNSMFPDLQFFLFRSMNSEAGMAFAYYRGESHDPTFMYITHGLAKSTD